MNYCVDLFAFAPSEVQKSFQTDPDAFFMKMKETQTMLRSFVTQFFDIIPETTLLDAMLTIDNLIGWIMAEDHETCVDLLQAFENTLQASKCQHIKEVEQGLISWKPLYKSGGPLSKLSQWTNNFHRTQSLKADCIGDDFFFLEIRVVRAQALPSADSNGLSDPYCLVKLLAASGAHGQEGSVLACRKTHTVPKELNPVWNGVFAGFSPEKKLLVENLVFECFDWDQVSEDDFLGRAVLPISEVRKAHLLQPAMVGGKTSQRLLDLNEAEMALHPTKQQGIAEKEPCFFNLPLANKGKPGENAGSLTVAVTYYKMSDAAKECLAALQAKAAAELAIGTQQEDDEGSIGGSSKMSMSKSPRSRAGSTTTTVVPLLMNKKAKEQNAKLLQKQQVAMAQQTKLLHQNSFKTDKTLQSEKKKDECSIM